nr:hypothetical protein [Tanacetum cinerariifolium]
EGQRWKTKDKLQDISSFGSNEDNFIILVVNGSLSFGKQNFVVRITQLTDADQVMFQTIHISNLSKGRKGRRKEKISPKEVIFTKADKSSSVLAPEIIFDSESECDNQEPFPPLPKLIRAAPSGTSENLISLFDLTLNMADLTLDTPVPKKTRPSVKVSPTYVIKKKTKKSHAGPNPCSDKKSDSSTKK